MNYAGYGQLEIPGFPNLSDDKMNCQQGVCIGKQEVFDKALSGEKKTGALMGVAGGVILGVIVAKLLKI